MEPLTRKEFFLNAIAEGTPTPPPLTREERYLAKIAENTGGGLPTIEEGDDGKVLTVSSGEAVWASGGGGGGGVTMTIVNVTVNDQDQLVLDKNYNEIKAILDAGNLAETFWDNEVGDYNYNLIIAYGTYDDGGTTLYYVKNLADEQYESNSPTGVLTYE